MKKVVFAFMIGTAIQLMCSLTASANQNPDNVQSPCTKEKLLGEWKYMGAAGPLYDAHMDDVAFVPYQRFIFGADGKFLYISVNNKLGKANAIDDAEYRKLVDTAPRDKTYELMNDGKLLNIHGAHYDDTEVCWIVKTDVAKTNLKAGDVVLGKMNKEKNQLMLVRYLRKLDNQ